MKNYLYVLIVFSVLSCTTENNDYELETKTFKNLIKSNAGGINSPLYAGNPYDYIGDAYNTVYDAYETLATKSTDPTIIVVTVESLVGGRGMMSDNDYIPVTAMSIIALKENATTTTALTSVVKNHLVELVNQLQILKNANEPYDSAYLKIIEKESAWQLSTVLTQNEKKILLYTSSVLRYSLYNTSKKKRKDRDWELSVGNIMATAYGATLSVPNTIVISVSSEYID